MESDPSIQSPARIWTARGVAVGADLLQMGLFPLFSEGILSPLDAVLDVVVCIALTLLVGWHIAFAPTFIIEQLPLVDLAPTWTLAVLIATRGKRALPAASSAQLDSNAVEKARPWKGWYDGLTKPWWTPSPRTIGRIWTILYPIIFTTCAYVFIQAARGVISWQVALPFAINLAANLLFTPILFGLRNLRLATLDIFIVLATIFWSMSRIWPVYPIIAVAQIPYAVWVVIATWLQVRIMSMNR